MLNKRTKRRTYLFLFDSSVFSITVAEDLQLPDNGGNRQGNPAPDGLLKGDGKVRTRSTRVRQRVRESGPGILRGRGTAGWTWSGAVTLVPYTTHVTAELAQGRDEASYSRF